MRQVAKYDRLQFKYEYEGASIFDLCAEHGYIIKDFTAYAEEHKWKQVDLSLPEVDEDGNDQADQIYRNYTTARRKLTLAAVRRAMVIWHRVQGLEDDILNMAETAIKTLQDQMSKVDTQPQLAPPNVGLEVSRLAKVIESVSTNNKLFNEALDVAAMNDSDRKDLDDETEILVKAIRRIVDPKSEDETDGEGQTGEELPGEQRDDLQD